MPVKIEKRKEYHREYHLRFKHTEQYRLNKRLQLNKFPEKRKARNAVSWAIYTGKIKKPNNCEICKKESKVEGHHEDYSKPLNVKWLCFSCHQIVDGRIAKAERKSPQ